MTDITREIVRALENDSALDFKRKKGKSLEQGICPGCGKRELFISREQPYRLCCNRTNNCGYTESTRSRYPYLFEFAADQFPPSVANPNATADAYLERDRGFDLRKIAGSYTQASYYHPVLKREIPTVRFFFDRDKTRYWERLIGVKKHEVKQRHNYGGPKLQLAESDPDYKEYNGSTSKGMGWEVATQKIQAGDTVFLVEGIFHAIALAHIGVKAIAIFAAKQFPELHLRQYYGKGIEWVMALDDDPTGREWNKRHAERLRDKGERVACALTGTGRDDWDDLLRQEKLSDDFIKAARLRGDIFFAESATEVAMLRNIQDPKRSIDIFEYNGATWCATLISDEEQQDLDHEGEDKLAKDARIAAFKKRCKVEMIADFWMAFSHSEINPLTDEAHYVFTINSLNGVRDYKIAIKGEKALESPGALDRQMLSTGLGLHFKGKPHHLEIMRDRLWFRKRPPLITTNQFLGYDKACRGYIFQSFAYHQGQRIDVNKAGFFEIGKHSVKTALRSVHIVDAPEQPITWFNDFVKVFDKNGVCALAFWLGSLFAEQIREREKSFFILEMSGAPGTGKSTLIEFLWMLLGRDDCEGIDPNKATGPALARHFMQVANMPVVLMEGDREDAGAKKGRFDFNELKSLYNGRSPRSRGVANGGVDTDEPPFKGSIVIEQNASVQSSPAVLSRICHLDFIERPFTDESRKLVKFFEQSSAKMVAGFLQRALRLEQPLLENYFVNSEKAREWLRGKLGHTKVSGVERVIKCHGQLLAMLGMLWDLLELPEGHALRNHMFNFVLARAQSRAHRLVADHPIVEQFWDSYHALINAYYESPLTAGKAHPLNHSSRHSEWAINLPHVYRLAEDYRMGKSFPPQTDVKALLHTSTHPKFIASNKQVRSAIHGSRPTKCWIFESLPEPTVEE